MNTHFFLHFPQQAYSTNRDGGKPEPVIEKAEFPPAQQICNALPASILQF
jgi:hypothetical protein